MDRVQASKDLDANRPVLVLSGGVFFRSCTRDEGILVNSLTPYRPPAVSPVPIMSDDEIERTWRIAKALAASRVFKDVTQAEQAFAKILLGRDLGLSPAQSMNAMDFVRGNVMLRSVTLASFVKKSPYYDYHVDEHTDTKCSITFFSLWPDGKRTAEGVSSFTIEDAKAAKLVKSDSAWTMYPRNMLFARAMSNGVRWFTPDMMGGIPVYTEGDSFVGDTVLGTVDEDPVEDDFQLPESVELVLTRAQRLGHDGLSDRYTANMTVTGQSEQFITDWCDRANSELDAMEAVGGSDPGNDDHVDIVALRARAKLLLEQAAVLREQKESDGADDLEDEALRLSAEADAREGKDDAADDE